MYFNENLVEFRIFYENLVEFSFKNVQHEMSRDKHRWYMMENWHDDQQTYIDKWNSS